MGIPFTLGIFPDITIRDNTCGLLAGSNSFYRKFNKLYYEYIKEFHDFEPNAAKIPRSEFTKWSIDQS